VRTGLSKGAHAARLKQLSKEMEKLFHEIVL